MKKVSVTSPPMQEPRNFFFPVLFSTAPQQSLLWSKECQGRDAQGRHERDCSTLLREFATRLIRNQPTSGRFIAIGRRLRAYSLCPQRAASRVLTAPCRPCQQYKRSPRWLTQEAFCGGSTSTDRYCMLYRTDRQVSYFGHKNTALSSVQTSSSIVEATLSNATGRTILLTKSNVASTLLRFSSTMSNEISSFRQSRN